MTFNPFTVIIRPSYGNYCTLFLHTIRINCLCTIFTGLLTFLSLQRTHQKLWIFLTDFDFKTYIARFYHVFLKWLENENALPKYFWYLTGYRKQLINHLTQIHIYHFDVMSFALYKYSVKSALNIISFIQ